MYDSRAMASVELAIIILTLCSVTGRDFPTVALQQGTLQGTYFQTVWGKECLAFLGIPYAKPPVADLRFRAPQPPESWEGIYNATVERQWCPQRHVVANTYVGSEDCLFLNIYTHKLPENASDLKAVMVWIHGGAFKFGTGSSVMYGPDHFLEEDIVIVTMQYRIGILGFLSLPEAGIPGNNGMKDQVMALRWVQKNIAKFGGDPNRVTIFGQSAGGASVHFHLLSPMSTELFHGAISQSGSALNPWAYVDPEALGKAAFEFGKNIGCETSNATELYHCLLRQPQTSLVDETSRKVQFVPTRESSTKSGEENFLTEHPENLISAGKFQDVPFVTGTILYESAFFLEMLSVTHTEDVASCLRIFAGLIPSLPEPAKIEKFLPKIKSIYYKENTTTEDGKTDLFTDIMFLFGAHQTVGRHAAMSSSPVYYYQFTYDGDLAFTKQIGLNSRKGPTHADELGYQFQAFFSPELDVESEDIKILRRMVKMWTNFAKYGDPTRELNSELSVKWDHVTTANNAYLKIDKEQSMQRDLQKERMALWEEIMGSTN